MQGQARPVSGGADVGRVPRVRVQETRHFAPHLARLRRCQTFTDRRLAFESDIERATWVREAWSMRLGRRSPKRMTLLILRGPQRLSAVLRCVS